MIVKNIIVEKKYGDILLWDEFGPFAIINGTIKSESDSSYHIYNDEGKLIASVWKEAVKEVRE